MVLKSFPGSNFWMHFSLVPLVFSPIASLLVTALVFKTRQIYCYLSFLFNFVHQIPFQFCLIFSKINLFNFILCINDTIIFFPSHGFITHIQEMYLVSQGGISQELIPKKFPLQLQGEFARIWVNTLILGNSPLSEGGISQEFTLFSNKIPLFIERVK